MMEQALIKAGQFNKRLDLSEQYLYWACKQIDGAPESEGSFIEYAMQALRRGIPAMSLVPGVCKERDWWYDSAPRQNNPTHGPPPQKALVAQKFAPSKAKSLECTSIKALKEALASGACVGSSVYTYHFWTDGYAWREGVISLPFEIPPDGAHAVCLVGYEDRDNTHADGYFLFKNSWGTNWGVGQPRRWRGFGRLPYRYVLEEAIEAWRVEL